jgi:hypothetical protein
MYKENVICKNNGILLNRKEEWKVDGTGDHHVE